MAVLNDADAIYLGSHEVDAIYLGSTQVWPNWKVGDLFANGELGALFLASDAATRFQDAAGATPTTTAEQPVGTLLDTSQGLVLGPELTPVTFASASGWWTGTGVSITGGQCIFTNVATANGVNAGNITTLGRYYQIEVTVDSLTSGALRAYAGQGTSPFQVLAPGVNRPILPRLGNTGIASIISIGTTNAAISRCSIRHLAGHHARQDTTTARPKYRIVGGKPAIIFDTIDDVLTMHAATAPGTCTVVRSVPGVGAEITTGVSVGTSHNLTQSFHGQLFVNRALTPQETTDVTKWANELAGITP